MFKLIVLPLLLGFGAGLILVAGQYMSANAMAVAIGVFAGVVTSVPASVLLVTLMRRRRA